MKELSVVFAIIGTVIGSGFISGKEIAVFFARFGLWSLPAIVLIFFLFWLLFYFLLLKGDKILKKLKKSKIFFVLSIFLSVIFTSAMFAGIGNLLNFDSEIINLSIFVIIFIFCTFIFKYGLSALNKINFVIVPIMLIIFLCLLSNKTSFSQPTNNGADGFLAIFYAILYVVLNTSNGCVMIAGLSKGLTSKQKARASFISSLVLVLLLLFINIVLLQHPSLISLDMPLLSLFSGWQKALLNIIVFIGCLTTLFSLIFSSSLTLRGLCNNDFLIFFISIVVPTLISLVGFGVIVTYLYPLASIVGIFLLLDILLDKR